MGVYLIIKEKEGKEEEREGEKAGRKTKQKTETGKKSVKNKSGTKQNVTLGGVVRMA